MAREYKSYEIDGHLLKCPICGCEEFTSQKTLMNTTAATFFGFDWANKSAVTFICKSCGYVLWFKRDRIKK